MTTEKHQKIKLQGDYQTARVAYANWLCALFGFWEVTADKVGAVEATAFKFVLVGFTSEETDPWLFTQNAELGPHTVLAIGNIIRFLISKSKGVTATFLRVK